MPPSDPTASDPTASDPTAPSARAEDLEWVSPYRPETDRAMARKGLRRVRLLDHMTRTLPVGPAERRNAAPLPVRPFRSGVDDEGLLRVNNRAFPWHPDQRDWDRDRLRARLAEPWVDPDGILLHEGPDGTIDGFCWTRVHPGEGDRPATGEIFLIAVDPERHGTGLGRGVVLAGLDHLAERGLTVAVLYVEADNGAAIRLYERLGFRVDHREAAYAPVGPAAAMMDR